MNFPQDFRLFVFPLVLLSIIVPAFPSIPSVDLVPVPARLEWGGGRLAKAPESFFIRGHDDARLRAGVARALVRVTKRTGVAIPDARAFAPKANDAVVVIDCAAGGASLPALGEDESYFLEVTSKQAVIKAPTVSGALHGLETLLQLLQSDASGWFIPTVSIRDQPRFPWRGLMIDVARHWQPMEVIKRNLGGMALVKLNVLHLHLTDDQGFRIESKKFPRLHELGSDGHYFTQDQIRELIAYAAERGIRVVPEFDIPGHATSWLVAYPELGSAPGPYAIERKWGIFDPVLDPTNPKVYEILDGFLGEMAALFPDDYLHIGGDENNGVHWNANAKIQAYIREKNLKDNAGLHAYFNGRVHAILAKHGKKLIGWDEILHPDLPSGSVVHSWRGPQGIADATQQGFATLLSNGYYIDLCHPAADHYRNDPVPAGSPLTDEQQKRVLGGEATMWSEWVTPETIDSRIWPRTAAIAERLWSPREVRDVPDMYRRLDIVSQRLAEAGLGHESYREPALRRLAGDDATADELEALRTFVGLLEPVKDYRRGGQQPNATQSTPLTGFVDCARPESATARIFAGRVNALVVAKPASAADLAWISQELATWKSAAATLATARAAQSAQWQGALPMLEQVRVACEVGEAAVRAIAAGNAPAPGWLDEQLGKLDQAAPAHDAVELPIIPALKSLVSAAAAPAGGSAGKP